MRASLGPSALTSPTDLLLRLVAEGIRAEARAEDAAEAAAGAALRLWPRRECHGLGLVGVVEGAGGVCRGGGGIGGGAFAAGELGELRCEEARWQVRIEAPVGRGHQLDARHRERPRAVIISVGRLIWR